MYLECKTERIFGIACLFVSRKSRLFRLLFAYSIFKNIEISSGQGVVQITKLGIEYPKSVKQKEFLASLGKKFVSNRKSRLFRYLECKTKGSFGV